MFIHNRLGLLEGTETLLAHEQRLHQVSNNLANVDTPGYKRETVTFGEMLYNANRTRQRVGKGLKIRTVHEQGVLQQTGNPLDLAISGQGFFRIQTPNGIRYTRAGNFQINNLGQVVTPDGYQLLGEGGPVVVDGQKVEVSREGRFFVDGAPVNQVPVIEISPNAITKAGENLYQLSEGGEELPAQDFQIQQGFVEKSNVNTVTEMTEMLDLYRAYEAQQKMIRTSDDLDDLAVRRVGVVTG
ncbi:MAG: flagellar basal-body rod protein FlgF [Thermodesulfobacteriota bacterium]